MYLGVDSGINQDRVSNSSGKNGSISCLALKSALIHMVPVLFVLDVNNLKRSLHLFPDVIKFKFKKNPPGRTIRSNGIFQNNKVRSSSTKDV